MCCFPSVHFMQTFLGAISQTDMKGPIIKSKCSLLRNECGIKELWRIEQRPLSLCVRQIKRRRGERAHVSTYALVCMCICKGQWGQYWHAIFWAHGAAAARPGVLRFLQRPPLWWPVSAHCHPDSTSVNMLKPLLLSNRSKPKETNASSSAVKAEK